MRKNVSKKLQSLFGRNQVKKSKGCFLRIFFRFKQHVMKICDHSQKYTGCSNFFGQTLSAYSRGQEKEKIVI